MEYKMHKLIEEFEMWGLKVYIQKTKYLCIGGESNDLILNNNKTTTNCQEYNYLGVIFDSTRTDNREKEIKIIEQKKAKRYQNVIIWSKSITKKRKFIASGSREKIESRIKL